MKHDSADRLGVDRNALSVTDFSDAEREDRAFWHSVTPIERLQHLETLRELNYGPEILDQGLQRVLEVLERPQR